MALSAVCVQCFYHIGIHDVGVLFSNSTAQPCHSLVPHAVVREATACAEDHGGIMMQSLVGANQYTGAAALMLLPAEQELCHWQQEVLTSS